MPHHARTYGSTIHEIVPNEAWKFPTGPMLDTFGVPIANQTFGLEEFNFNPILVNKQFAYVPCYGTHTTYPRPLVNELRLIYRVNNMADFNYVHYATLFNVRTMVNEDIPEIRRELEPHFNSIYLSEECEIFFGLNYPEYQNHIQNMFNANLIADNENNSSFVVNVRYESLEILDNPVPCVMKSNFASNWYENVIYP
jgi:hypothetical protein